MSEVIVVGAGIIGMLTARELAAVGHTVTVLERARPARESSWAGGGILSPLYPWRYPDVVSELARWSQRAYPGLCEALRTETGIDPECEPSGLLIGEPGDLDDARAWAARFDAGLEVTDAAGARALEPRLGVDFATGAWLPAVGQVRNPRMVRALRASLELGGVEIRSDCPVQGWERSGARIAAVRTPAGRLSADVFVVASGAWSGALLEQTGLRLPIEPVRGQMVLFRGPPGLLRRITLYEGRYAIPRRDGRVLFGSTLEYTGFEKRATPQALEELRRDAARLIPALADLPVECHWAGLRPGSPDGVPAIGPHPEIANLYVCSGHFRNGVVLGPASARLLVDQLSAREPILDPAPCQPARLARSSPA